MNSMRPTDLDLHCSAGSRPVVHTWHVIALWMICMFPLIFWGLPTSRDDALLFGGDQAWPAERYRAGHALDARRARVGGADTDLNPFESDKKRIVDLTADEAGRAEILRRYRLFSRQPDEMITFMALQRMNPRKRDFDPQLYQYGGGYIYLIAAVLGSSSLVGLTTLSGDASVYLTEPELFARFYVVARIVTLIFGALALVATIKLARRAAGRVAGWIAFVFVAASPVFIAGVLEAKPHVPSVCMLLWAILSALKYESKSRRRDALRMGLQAGYAFGLVLTGLVGALLWPLMFNARGVERLRTRIHLVQAAGLALLVYILTNPYFLYNLFFNKAALAGNLGNSTAMYNVTRLAEGLGRVAQLMLASCGPCVTAGGLVGLFWLCLRRPKRTALAGIPGLAMLLLCIVIGAGKPAEFARFLLLPAILFAIASAAILATLISFRPVWGIALTVIALGVMRTPAYLHSYYIDAFSVNEARHQAALYIHDQIPRAEAIGVVQEPAPYSIPPMDFAHRTVQLLPQDEISPEALRELPKWVVCTADDLTTYRDSWWQEHYYLVESFAAKWFQLSPISWANKPVYIYRLKE